MGINSISSGLKFRLFCCLQSKFEVKSLSGIGHCAHFGQWSGRRNWLIPPTGAALG